jgi:hypothetical protein
MKVTRVTLEESKNIAGGIQGSKDQVNSTRVRK